LNPELTTFQVYKRALTLLAEERWAAIAVGAAAMVNAAVLLAEPVLFGRVVDALSGGREAFPIIALWAAIGLFGIVAGTGVSVAADRLAHRRRLAAMAQAFERGIILPISYHAEKGSGAVVRTILAGSDTLFWTWLSFLREQLTALVGILMMVPLVIRMNGTMALILGALAVLYVAANVLVARKTSKGQAAVEQYHINVAGRVGDVLGNVTVVQSYARLSAEMQAMRAVMGELLAAQYPVLTWWGLVTVLTRAAATVTVVVILSVGALLVARKEATAGDIVAFIWLANVMIGKLTCCRVSPCASSRPRRRCAAISTCSTPPRRCGRRRAHGRWRTSPARCATRTSPSGSRTATRASSTSISMLRPARPLRWWGRRAPAKRPRSRCCNGCARPGPGAS